MISYLASSVPVPHVSNLPHVHFTEVVWAAIGIIGYGLYLSRRTGAGLIHYVGALILGALSAGLWPAVTGKVSGWGAAGAAEKSTVYAVLVIVIGFEIFYTERARRGSGGGEE